MIKFNELRITPNNENLIIDVSIEDAEYFKDVVLDSIIIDTQDTYTANGPSDEAVFTYSVVDDYSKKSVRLILKSEDLGVPIAGNIFFVHVIATGEPTADTPYELRNSKIIGTVINTYPIYKQSMKYTKELGDSCNIPKNFVDYIFRIKALDLAIRTGNYLEAIKYWNKFFKPFNYNI